MTYAFYHNLGRISLVLGLVIGFCFLPMLADFAQAKSRTSQSNSTVRNTVNNPNYRSYGPDVGSQSQSVTGGKTIVDAYGKPVIPEDEQQNSRPRLRSGAYGGSGSEQNTSSLPDLPETDAGWKFK